MGCEAQLASKCLLTPTFLIQRAILTRTEGQTDRVLPSDQGSLVGLCTQGYKSLCAEVTICATLVNIQIDIHTQMAFDQLIRNRKV